MLVMYCGDIWRENYHLDTTLLCGERGLTLWPIREVQIAFFTKDDRIVSNEALVSIHFVKDCK